MIDFICYVAMFIVAFSATITLIVVAIIEFFDAFHVQGEHTANPRMDKRVKARGQDRLHKGVQSELKE